MSPHIFSAVRIALFSIILLLYGYPAFAVLTITDGALTVSDNSGNALSSQTITLSITPKGGTTTTVEAETDDDGKVFFLFSDSDRSGKTPAGQVLLPNDGQVVVKEDDDDEGVVFWIAGGDISRVSPSLTMNGDSTTSGRGQRIGVKVHVGGEAIHFINKDFFDDLFNERKRFARDAGLGFDDSIDDGEWGGGFEADIEITNLLTFDGLSLSMLIRGGVGELPDYSGEATLVGSISTTPTSTGIAMERNKATLLGDIYYYGSVGPLFNIGLPFGILSVGVNGGYMQFEQDLKIRQILIVDGVVVGQNSNTKDKSGGGFGYDAMARLSIPIYDNIDSSLGFSYGCWEILGQEVETYSIFGKIGVTF